MKCAGPSQAFVFRCLDAEVKNGVIVSEQSRRELFPNRADIISFLTFKVLASE